MHKNKYIISIFLFLLFTFVKADASYEVHQKAEQNTLFSLKPYTEEYELISFANYRELIMNLEDGEPVNNLLFIDNSKILIETVKKVYLYDILQDRLFQSNKSFALTEIISTDTAIERIFTKKKHTFHFVDFMTGKLIKTVELSDKWNWISPDSKSAVSINNDASKLYLRDLSQSDENETEIGFEDFLFISSKDIYYLGDKTFLFNAHDMRMAGDEIQSAIGIANIDGSLNTFYRHNGVTINSYNRNTIVCCNTNEFDGSDSCRTIYKINDNQLVPTSIPIGINNQLSFNGKYILSYDTDPPFWSDDFTPFNETTKYNLNVYSFETENLLFRYQIDDEFISDFSNSPSISAISPNVHAISCDAKIIACLSNYGNNEKLLFFFPKQ